MSMKTQIEDKLQAAFQPEMLEVIDESEQHRGHGGWREVCETHFKVRMTSTSFTGQSRVNRQRAVNKCLSDELASSVHALAMELRSPEDQ